MFSYPVTIANIVLLTGVMTLYKQHFWFTETWQILTFTCNVMKMI